jgi:hypothetical protein
MAMGRAHIGWRKIPPSDRVEKKVARDRIREVHLNPSAMAPAGAIPNPHPNPSGFRPPTGFY